MREEVLRLEKVTRIVDGVTLLDDFNLHIFKGEIMGLLCINAHGQRELVELLCQNLPIHYGRIYLNDVMVNNYEYSSLTMNKVAVIEKESRLIEDLTAADNIFVMRRGFKKYYISKNTLNSQLKLITQELHINIDGNELTSNLSPFQKAVVELLKAVVAGVKFVIVKDISNYVSAADLVKFHELLKYYCRQGFTFLYICSHHEEAFKICTRVSLMEDGKILKVLDQKEYTMGKMLPYTNGFYDVTKPGISKERNEEILQFENVCTDNLNDMSFVIEKGECVTLLDMNNTVLTDIIKVMNGEMELKSGSIYLDDRLYLQKDACRAIERGVGFIGEFPLQSMMFKEMSYLENLTFLVDKKQKNIRLSRRVLRSIIKEYEPLIGKDIYEKDVTMLGPASLYSMIYYRLHLYNPKVIFCVQPFSGADMYLRLHIIKLIQKLKEKGITVVILAVNMSDSLMVADRLMVIEEGHLSREYGSTEFHSLL